MMIRKIISGRYGHVKKNVFVAEIDLHHHQHHDFVYRDNTYCILIKIFIAHFQLTSLPLAPPPAPHKSYNNYYITNDIYIFRIND